MSATRKFVNGGATSNTIDRQFRPEKVLQAVVEFPKRKKTFSGMASVLEMPKNHGDTVTKEVRYPMLHEDNVVDGNISTAFATQATGIFYSGNGNVFDATNYLRTTGGDFAAAVAAAKVDAAADGGVTAHSPNGIVNGKASYSAFKGALVPLPEEGGVLNGLMSTSKLISSKITFHTAHTKYTVRSVDLDSRVGLIARSIADLGDAVADLKEQQVQGSLQTAANNNRMISTADVGTTTVAEIDGLDVLSYDSLEAFGLELQDAEVPMDTEIIKGVDLQDTVTVSDAYIMYINREVVPSLTRLVGPGGILPWQPKEKYAAGTELLDGEAGMITGLPFRFVVVADLQREFGAGEQVAHANDGASATTQGAAIKTLDKDGNSYYDVFSGLVIGDDSFSITGFGYNSTKAAHIKPKRDVHNDITGSVGGVSAEWSFSNLVYRPERIRKISFSLQRNGRTAD